MASLRRSAIQVLRQQKRSKTVCGVRHGSSNVEKNIQTSEFKPLPPISGTVSDFVWQNLDRWPDKTATVCALTGHGYTYAQTHRMSMVFAASLIKKLKLGNDDKVAIILPNLPEYPCTLLGTLQAGCIATVMNPAYTAHEFQRQFELVDCKAIVTSRVSLKNVSEALNKINRKIPVILIDTEVPEGVIKFAELAEDQHIDTDCLKSVRRGPKDLAVIPFSSGTTGFPKGVVLNHGSVIAANHAISDPEIVAIEETTETHQSVFPAILPFFHIFGFNALMLNQMYLGCKLITMPYFKPELFLQTVAKNKADVLFIVPPMVVFLGKHPAVLPAHLSSIKSIISGAAPLSEADVQAVLNKNPNINFRQGYGLTETNGILTVGDNKDKNHKAVGKTLAGCEVKIADLETQEALAPGKEGEIWCRGPNNMLGYYKDEKSTKEVLTEDGWYKTGDIGKYDDNKHLYITDRIKELIKVKGFQVPPAELEAIIRSHPKIADCAVLGIPDPITGESPKAFIVPLPNQTVKEEEIKEFVNSKVIKFKNIKEVAFVDSIPKNAAGKILRKELKAKYC